jgi:murein L,D-transpeptidase YcbB/YkuD
VANEPDPPAPPTLARDVPGIEFSRRLNAWNWPRDMRPLRQGVAAFYAGRSNAPIWTDDNGFNDRARAVIAELSKADDWGLRSSDYQAPAAPADDPDARFDAELALTAATLRYARDARGGRYDPNRLSLNIDRKPPILPPEQVLARLSAGEDAAAALKALHPQHPQFEKLRQLYLQLRDATPEQVATLTGIQQVVEDEPTKPRKSKTKSQAKPDTDPKKIRARILYNMEMWRWMPERLGDYHITANVPEFKVRVMKDGKPLHTERVITGKVQNQTPLFSDEMEFVVFHPFWAVPDSIKVKELLPGLVRGKNTISRQGLRASYKGRDVDPYSVNWQMTDIRNFHIYQPPGRSNALGIVKFLFPNKHHVYMHDTPTKHLFKQSTRAFSHGCIRVRDPIRLAEILLENDKGWSPERIKSIIANGKEDNSITLDRKVPVHVTYFTAVVGDDGKPVFFRDIYGHERLIQMGLDGKAHQIVLKKQKLDDLVGMNRGQVRTYDSGWGNWGGGGYSTSQSSGDRSWIRNAFNND